jgi:hypothetical protein
VNIAFYSKSNQMHQFLKFIFIFGITLHVSDSLSVHHQEIKTAHTATEQLASGNKMDLSFHLIPASKQAAVPV